MTRTIAFCCSDAEYSRKMSCINVCFLPLVLFFLLLVLGTFNEGREKLFHSVLYVHSPSSLCETKSLEDPPSVIRFLFLWGSWCTEFEPSVSVQQVTIVRHIWFLLPGEYNVQLCCGAMISSRFSCSVCFHSDNKKENVPVQLMNHLRHPFTPPSNKQSHHPGVVCRSDHVPVSLQRRR